MERAIEIVERLLKKVGAPLYVHHDIVHNKVVVDSLKERGCIFVEDVNLIPIGSYVVFSAHGVSEKVELDSEKRGLIKVDATCPLVKKVHNEVINYSRHGREILLIGHAGHPEVIGTMGRAPGIRLIQNVEDAHKVEMGADVAYVTQTTLSIDETAEIIDVLKARNSDILHQSGEDICYATQNRQNAAKAIIGEVDMLFVIGSKNSSNSNRLAELGLRNGIRSYLIDGKEDIDINWLYNVTKLGITSGASAPESIVEDILGFLQMNFDIKLSESTFINENISFKLPGEIR
ncbi:4-hydroxy-3-methylbut-2-enyl diphosphate reductase [Candidatus Cyrtobacter comes]|uniref:4-hydroxy-3-methylbut-2-enyl diphosphate reductase n=1 Tax=Candidatus Cyrtobacter comes TaxID=675776 RepID=A0ABU5L6E6_9RICK|nr:4-hydroxy-3-methylbut-2-enyl diphosphate reductase [Candidatus Cyrtobacter comes]